MKTIFTLIGVAGYFVGVSALLDAPTITQQIFALAIILNASLFAIAGLWPSRSRQKVGSGEIGGLQFDYYDDGTVAAVNGRGKRTRFPSFEVFERCLKSQHPSKEEASLYYDGWGKRTGKATA
ncbi:hypothetical protein [Aurantimonas sp. 22II-16-19i]|uniref:hypothetical protein n=1 Tax=Aurantimonas sp. 22II-16-19i TaxID=1317114 RepID=UPI0009F7E9E1|nr:hypothetical protein [Aurantimonas sp. 22II-16-19i]ORE91002.1 hypothetical protein ATO4_20109 [Aurantimonas sp. 22II-16-19i]